jgi:hypothetical protein
MVLNVSTESWLFVKGDLGVGNEIDSSDDILLDLKIQGAPA